MASFRDLLSQVKQSIREVDPAGAGGDLFGLALAPYGRGVLFVDDGDNTLKLFGPPPAW